jgi:protoporphyrin/coproporphyrin ferrochelatase
MSSSIILANFGGPRNLDEVRPFLEELLTDQDVVRTGFPRIIHNFLFRRIAKKRTHKVSEDYRCIGGRSPIYQDTETLANLLSVYLEQPVIAFHRYLPLTHRDFSRTLLNMAREEIRVFPLFPQFTYATTGSIARWFDKHLPKNIVSKMHWVKSYPSHPGFVQAYQNSLKEFLASHALEERECFFLFSAHGLPQSFVDEGDPYEQECRASYQQIISAFPQAHSLLAYQSKFGKGEWLRPYTIDVCQGIKSWSADKKHVIVVPVAFTSDHIETLFEIEQLYLPIVRQAGLAAYRLPALSHRPDWIQGILSILDTADYHPNHHLIRSN